VDLLVPAGTSTRLDWIQCGFNPLQLNCSLPCLNGTWAILQYVHVRHMIWSSFFASSSVWTSRVA
jgi:hypothetical protein